MDGVMGWVQDAFARLAGCAPIPAWDAFLLVGIFGGALSALIHYYPGWGALVSAGAVAYAVHEVESWEKTTRAASGVEDRHSDSGA